MNFGTELLVEVWRGGRVESEHRGAIAVVDAALMIETGSYRRFDKLVVVYCDADLQRERLMLRNNLTLEQAQARISAQMPSDEKLKFADYSINTSFSFEETREKVVELYGQLSEFKASQVNIGERER